MQNIYDLMEEVGSPYVHWEMNLEGKHAIAHIMLPVLEDQETIRQIYALCNDPSFRSDPEDCNSEKGHIYVMPDTHAGKGNAVIGLCVVFNGRIIPNVVGVDVSCGMYGIRFRPGAFKNLDRLHVDQLVRQAVPMGGGKVCSEAQMRIDDFGWPAMKMEMVDLIRRFNAKFETKYRLIFEPNTDYFTSLCEKAKVDPDYALRSVGSLGGGNHFIELGIDNEDHCWIVVHSGSRNLGAKVATYWQKEAVKYTRNLVKDTRKGCFGELKTKGIAQELWKDAIEEAITMYSPTKGLEFLEGQEALNYLLDCVFLEVYAQANRIVIADNVMKALSLQNSDIDRSIVTTHNYIHPHDMVIRKGAVWAPKGHPFILPFNMEDGMLICEGRGNEDWLNSAPHGAGRISSRADAKKKAAEEGHVEKARKRMQEKGIVSTVLPADELRESYKEMEVIKTAIQPTARVILNVKPWLNFKAKG